jgi:hypothetical protein
MDHAQDSKENVIEVIIVKIHPKLLSSFSFMLIELSCNIP